MQKRSRIWTGSLTTCAMAMVHPKRTPEGRGYIQIVCPFWHPYLKKKVLGLTGINVSIGHALCSDNVGTRALSAGVSLANLATLVIGEVVNRFGEA